MIKTAIGNNEREKYIALEQLHGVIANKKRGGWTKIHEDLMKRHLELSIDLKDIRFIKDGLHQYRNLCQNVSDILLILECLFLLLLFIDGAYFIRVCYCLFN